jgi:2-polyprenyl-3-methyl-5-hydroxy-6-metoxy-1,4-benzoquinol methylase
MKRRSIDWDQDYQAGRWDGADEKEQLSRYALLGGIITLTGASSLLDVGCGRGLLREFIPPDALTSYTGLDVSQVALNKVSNPKPYEKFVCTRLEDWQPEGVYEAIVMNEVLYYLEDPCEALNKMSRCLHPGGALVISIYQKSGWRSPNRRALKEARAFLVEKGWGLIEDIEFCTNVKGRNTWSIIVARAAGSTQEASR